jgi:ABC-type antimicrobial peptide transport system permease subunit
MSPLRLIVDSLIHHRRTNLAVALGAAVATAVLAGALLVGDSMRGSLRDLALDRLGRIDDVLLVPQFFRTRLADELAADPGFSRQFAAAVPAIVLETSIESDQPQSPQRANRVTLLAITNKGTNKGVGSLFPGAATAKATETKTPDPFFWLNGPLAEKLGVKVGDTVLVHLPLAGAIPGDSPLGRKQETIEAQRLTVTAIIPAEGLGRFALRSNQVAPRNAYVDLQWLQQRLGQADRANAIFVAGKEKEGAAPPPLSEAMVRPWQPQLTDYGLRLRHSPRGYWDITSARMILEPAAEDHLLKSLAGETVQPVFTYLANRMVCGDRAVPYSTVSAVDFTAVPPLGPMLDEAGKPIAPLGDDQIVLNRPAADDLRAKPGDKIELSFFEPQSTHGKIQQRTVRFTLAAITPLEGAADDRGFTPEVPGVTDKRSIADWNPPFPFHAEWIRPQDDAYWRKYGATPKAFVSLATGRKLWASRFGGTTSLRFVGPAETTAAQWEAKLALPPATMGFVFQPVKREGLAAAAGTTPFGVLFVAFSSFTIAAAIMLVTLLFRLGIETRADEIGILLALGIAPRRVGRWLLGEGMLVVLGGGLLGMPLGIGYAALMLMGLRTWWVSAISTPFLQLHLTLLSPLLGAGITVVMALAAMAVSVRRVTRVPCRSLLAGEISTGGGGGWTGKQGWRRARWITWILASLLVAGVVGVSCMHLDETGRALAFFGSGAVTLATLIVIIWARMRAGATAAAVAVGRGNLLRLALRNAARNPGRSSLTIGLVASAAFLIASMSAFHVDPQNETPLRNDGTGGFTLVAQTDQPIYQDLNTPEGRKALGFSPADSQLLSGTSIIALRVKPGDDASCRNLYQPQRPRVLGVPPALVEHDGFAWDSSAATTPQQRANPWLLLKSDLGADKAGQRKIPVILEKNTAAYALHLEGGVGDTYQLSDSRGRNLSLEVVGLLDNSIFQGDLLLDEQTLLDQFPEINGYQFFLVEAPAERATQVQSALERTLGDYGLFAQSSTERLAGFLAVQNTYLSTFQSLGGLGLLLGTLGLAAVQLRNIAQRRRELALLRATGFTPAALAWMVLLETGALLLLGLASGVVAALVAVLPHLIYGGAAIPWLSLGAILVLVALAGLAAGLIAVRATLAAPLLPALRGE